jgi:membrane-associated phospholipid phosphatase
MTQPDRTVAMGSQGVGPLGVSMLGESMVSVTVEASETNDAIPLSWATVAQSLTRPYRVSVSMVALVALVPLYIFIPELFPPAARHVPVLTLDGAIPLIPMWALVYGALYFFLILLPIVVVREDDLIRRTVHAYLLIWLTAYLFFFVLYPTEAPRPARVVGDGFAVWGLRALYSSDPPYNCFPSLHVAHSFVSALAAHRVNRRVGVFATICASLVALSTLFTKQHYVVDVIGGVGLALIASFAFLARYPRERIDNLDRRVAPALALCILGVVALALLGAWVGYLWTGETRFDFGP